jgi:hypothetical protein
VANGVVYISDGDQEGTLYALDASTGNKLASLQVGTPIEASTAVVVNGTVYIGGFDQQLHAFALPQPRRHPGRCPTSTGGIAAGLRTGVTSSYRPCAPLCSRSPL